MHAWNSMASNIACRKRATWHKTLLFLLLPLTQNQRLNSVFKPGNPPPIKKPKRVQPGKSLAPEVPNQQLPNLFDSDTDDEPDFYGFPASVVAKEMPILIDSDGDSDDGGDALVEWERVFGKEDGDVDFLGFTLEDL